ncbi:MAG TPA: BamA/TamA family outer membrane protein [Gemmatimonadaceae bacterium]|nr:BamA/TamA family outer membrane protein [Gemmatimonadaceae bacterium]
MRCPLITSRAFRAAAMLLGTLTAAVEGQSRRVEISGVPAVNFDADEGYGYGAILQLYSYDAGAASYRWTIQPTVFLTTEGRRDYTLFFGAPAGPNRPWRYTVYAGREQQLATPYYGIGNATAYDASLESGSTRYFYRYGRDRLRATADVQHAIWHPALRALVGAGASNDKIDLTPFDSGRTLIERDLSGVTPKTGHTNYLRTGLTWDTRDREIGPRRGTWADVIVQRVDTRLGASASYTRWTATARHYQPIGSRVTLANRVLAQNVHGSAPFYVLSELQTTQRLQDGLGGASSVRGLPKDRYVGKGTVLTNNELRWRAADFNLHGRPSSLVLSGFVDAGRVWADGIELSGLTRDLRAGYGAGARLAFGPSFVVAIDVGHSAQSTAPVYIGLGYLF